MQIKFCAHSVKPGEKLNMANDRGLIPKRRHHPHVSRSTVKKKELFLITSVRMHVCWLSYNGGLIVGKYNMLILK